MDTLERILILFGTMFSSRLWEMIFRGVIFPIFNNIGYSKGLIRFPEEVKPQLFFNMILFLILFCSSHTNGCPLLALGGLDY